MRNSWPTISFEPVDGFSLDLYRYINVTSLRADYTLVP